MSTLVCVWQQDWNNNDELRMVAVVNAPTDNNDLALDDAYAMTQTVDDYWWNNGAVQKCFTGKGCASTSVGDVLHTSQGWFRVEPVGFERVDPEQLNFGKEIVETKSVEEIDL
jgi:hypothetical protein